MTFTLLGPSRATKPRRAGLTHVIDTGLGPHEIDDLIAVGAAHVDLVRLGWGSALVTGCLDDKLARLRAAGIPVMLGGTLTELAWRDDRVDALVAWLRELDIDRIEVSSGTIAIPQAEKLGLIERFVTAGLTVYAEVGEKAPEAIMAPYEWVAQIQQAFAAGASLVICEGRASGTAGLHRHTAEIRTGLVEEIVHGVGLDNVVFEAPLTAQQAWFITHFGPDVNLGNVHARDIVSLESLRLGLRSDTIAEGPA
jgi:phosphosulfolactate synthase